VAPLELVLSDAADELRGTKKRPRVLARPRLQHPGNAPRMQPDPMRA